MLLQNHGFEHSRISQWKLFLSVKGFQNAVLPLSEVLRKRGLSIMLHVGEDVMKALFLGTESTEIVMRLDYKINAEFQAIRIVDFLKNYGNKMNELDTAFLTTLLDSY
ncbi:hypothetical protein TNCV_5022451 [Trichonephila clavipes]|nr:hypothetical protein TNCV_5022451 [Trichonephila clavipes]